MSRNILVTGGTGSFGKAYVASKLRDPNVRRIVVYSRDELKQSQMRAVMRGTFKDADERLRFVVGDVTDTGRLAIALRGVDLCVHAAAMKQIDTCELNPAECVRINVGGTQSVISAILAAKTPKAIFLSTDKAAAPATLYGACKLTAERLWVQANVYAAGTPTQFSATRYGNVLGSRGSVVEVWRRQIRYGVVPTVTDAAMTRFWMTIDHAVRLVDLAADKMLGGEVFIPKVKAAGVLTLLDAVRDGDVAPHEETGIRRGEKLHEVLITREESRYVSEHFGYFTILPDRSWGGEAHDIHDDADLWEFRSDTAPTLGIEQLQEMISE